MKKVQVAILATAICLTAAGCGNTLQKSANPSTSIYNYKEHYHAIATEANCYTKCSSA